MKALLICLLLISCSGLEREPRIKSYSYDKQYCLKEAHRYRYNYYVGSVFDGPPGMQVDPNLYSACMKHLGYENETLGRKSDKALRQH